MKNTDRFSRLVGDRALDAFDGWWGDLRDYRQLRIGGLFITTQAQASKTLRSARSPWGERSASGRPLRCRLPSRSAGGT